MAPSEVTQTPNEPRLLNREESMEALVLLGVAREFLEQGPCRLIDMEQFRACIVRNIREFFDGLDD
jgi:hypothetical protein